MHQPVLPRDVDKYFQVPTSRCCKEEKPSQPPGRAVGTAISFRVLQRASAICFIHCPSAWPLLVAAAKLDGPLVSRRMGIGAAVARWPAGWPPEPERDRR
ncbi:unnamed protein product [Urochloa humidicola]